jgi:hypothetical protein
MKSSISAVLGPTAKETRLAPDPVECRVLPVVGTGVDPVTSRFSGARSAN